MPGRREPLRTDPERAADWQRRSRQRAAENAASRPRKPLSRASGLRGSGTGLERGRGPQAGRTAARGASAAEPGKAEAAAAFYAVVCHAGARCLACGRGHDAGRLDAHHAVQAQTLRRIANTAGLEGAERWAVIYDPAIGVPLHGAFTRCAAHERHTSRTATIPRSALPASVIDAAEGLGPEAAAALEREHPA